MTFAGCEITVRIGRHGETGDGTGVDAGADVQADASSDGMAFETSRPDGAPPMHAALTSQSKVDLLFLIDDSASIAPLQAKLRGSLSNFMTVLEGVPGGLPDLHVGVVSSSLGAGIFADVPGCGPSIGNLQGDFQHNSTCTGLALGEAYLRTGGSGTEMANFTGDITDVLDCLADLGDNGCGFEHQLAATMVALQNSNLPSSGNYGFLRSDALLAVVMLTNEDDCSVPADSDLFDPSQTSVNDGYGGLHSYRCNEFGHRCDQPLPHLGPDQPITLTGCHSTEDGKLVRVGSFIDYLFSLKPGHPENVFVAMIAGANTPYVVGAELYQLPTGGQEIQPVVQHSCVSTIGDYADPGVRLADVTAALAPNSVFASICGDDFGPMLTGIARQLAGE